MGEPLSEDHKTALREHLVAAHGCKSSTVATWTGAQLFHGHVRAHESAPERLGPPHPVEVHEAPGEDDRISQILRERGYRPAEIRDFVAALDILCRFGGYALVDRSTLEPPRPVVGGTPKAGLSHERWPVRWPVEEVPDGAS